MIQRLIFRHKFLSEWGIIKNNKISTCFIVPCSKIEIGAMIIWCIIKFSKPLHKNQINFNDISLTHVFVVLENAIKTKLQFTDEQEENLN